MQDETVASELHLCKVWQLQPSPCRSRSEPLVRRVASLDEILKYVSRLNPVRIMTGYGKCCGRRIVAQNWKHCPFCGRDLIAGFIVPLRQQIETGMDVYLSDLERTEILDTPSRPTMNWNMKRLRLEATKRQIVGRSKMSKADLVEALKALPLFDF